MNLKNSTKPSYKIKILKNFNLAINVFNYSKYKNVYIINVKLSSIILKHTVISQVGQEDYLLDNLGE